MSRDEQIKAFIARKGVTKCPAAKASAKSLRRMRREHEIALADRFMGVEQAPMSAEQFAERSRERFLAAKAAGASNEAAWEEVDALL